EDEKLKILIVNRMKNPFMGSPALPGGFVKKGETTLDTVFRVLKEKAGVKDVYVEQLYTFDSLKRDPRGQIISVTYFALLPRDQIKINKTKATENPEFVSIKEL